MSDFTIGEPGTSKLYEERAKKYKIGEVAVSARDLVSVLHDLDHYGPMLYPLKLAMKPKKGKLEDTLKTDLAFSRAKESIIVQIHHTKPMPLMSLFREFVRRTVAVDLSTNLALLVSAKCGIAATSSGAGESTEHHKEMNDKDALRTLLVFMSAKRHKAERIVYSDEVMFKTPNNEGPHGILDLLVGTRSDHEGTVPDDAIVVMVSEKQVVFDEIIAGESKSPAVRLAKITPVTSDISDCKPALVQPVLQLLAISQIKSFHQREPTVLFFGSRTHFRPLIYYHSADILLTTRNELQWMKKDGVDLNGATIVALLMQTTQAVEYYDVTGDYMKDEDFPCTGFQAALTNSGVNLAASTLSCTHITRTPAASATTSSASGVDIWSELQERRAGQKRKEDGQSAEKRRRKE